MPPFLLRLLPATTGFLCSNPGLSGLTSLPWSPWVPGLHVPAPPRFSPLICWQASSRWLLCHSPHRLLSFSTSTGHCALRTALAYPSSCGHLLGVVAPPASNPLCLASATPPHRRRGTCSSAFWQVPRERDSFKDLRHAWLRRIMQPGFIPSVPSRLNSDAKAPPLSPDELLPFFGDLRSWLQVSDQALWSKLLEIDDGQPFRLNLWHALSLIGSDPDSAFFDLLHTGVPLGIGTPIPVCCVLPPPDAPSPPVIPLQHCDSAWQSAIDNADIVDKLLEEELSEGWIRLVPGGDAELRRNYAHSAVGKLGVVLSDDRPPRLVVDSSISGVTDHTVLPNKAPNPTLQDVRRCLPLDAAQEELCALVLDVSKAHRRVRIRPAGRGLLCFRHRDRLYQSVTLNFGARASGYYWNRVAGLLVRFLHRLLFSAHSAFIYVDDILALLDRRSAPVWTCLLVVAILVLNVPMSWHKASLSSRVTWIGWQFDFRRFTIRLDPVKLNRLQLLCNSYVRPATVPSPSWKRLLANSCGCLRFLKRSDRHWRLSTWTSTCRCLPCRLFPQIFGINFALRSLPSSLFPNHFLWLRFWWGPNCSG